MKGQIISSLKRFNSVAKQSKCNSFVLGWIEIGFSGENHCFLASLSQRRYIGSTSFLQAGSVHSHLQKTLLSAREIPPIGSNLAPKRNGIAISCRCNHSINNSPELNRFFLRQLWHEDRKRLIAEENRKKVRRNVDNVYSPNKREEDLKQPPTSEPIIGFLRPTSPEEALVAPLLARSNLLITRDIEWVNLTIGIEQESRYAIVDVYYPQSHVGSIREKSNILARQVLRTRRPFMAYVTDALGTELFRVRRPFWWINSSIYTVINGKEIGVVHRRWHLWKRIYDLYLGDEQFAVVENPGFWNWTFTLKDINGDVLAEIDRNWRGFGFELFTDAGQYAIRFGSTSGGYPHDENQELQVKRPLTLSERAVAVALAVSLDSDYFSRHGGLGIPYIEVGE